MLYISRETIMSIIDYNNYQAVRPHIQTSTNHKTYSVIKYIKENLTLDNVGILGLYRSVIVKKNSWQIVCVSPPKSISPEVFMATYDPSSIVAEQFIEGTMINVFWDMDGDGWMVNTKSKVGAEC